MLIFLNLNVFHLHIFIKSIYFAVQKTTQCIE